MHLVTGYPDLQRILCARNAPDGIPLKGMSMVPYSAGFFSFRVQIEGFFPAVDRLIGLPCSPVFLVGKRSLIWALFACTGDDVPPLVSGIFLFQEHLILLVYYAPMPDSKNEDTIRKDGIEYSPVPDTIFIQSFELTCQCFANFRIFCKYGLDFKDYPFCNRSVNLLEVIEDRSLIINSYYQGGFSSPLQKLCHHPCPSDVREQ